MADINVPKSVIIRNLLVPVTWISVVIAVDAAPAVSCYVSLFIFIINLLLIMYNN